MNAFRLISLWKRLTDTSWTPSWCHHVSRDKEWLSRNQHWQFLTNSNDEHFWKYECKSWSKYLSSPSLRYTSEDIKQPNTSDKETERLFAKSLQREAERHVSLRLHSDSNFLKILTRIRHIVSQFQQTVYERALQMMICMSSFFESSEQFLKSQRVWWTYFKYTKRWLFAFMGPDPKEFQENLKFCM